jgi:arylsulfatase A-like enzyme
MPVSTERVVSLGSKGVLGAAVALVLAVGAAMAAVPGSSPAAARVFTGTVGISGGAEAVGTVGISGGAEAAEDPPNILIVLTDDQRVGTWSAMPETQAWLGDGGVTYTHAYATTPLCCPSRASILSGRYAHNHGVQANRQWANLDGDTTMARYLHDAGYRTGIVGKYLNWWPVEQTPPHFDAWTIFNGRAGDGAYYGSTWNVNGDLREIDQYSTRYISNRAATFLRAREAADDTPWFLYVATFAPHLPAKPAPLYESAPVPPWQVPPSATETNRADKPPYVQDSEATVAKGREIRAAQLRTLYSVDDMVGRFGRLLDEMGEDNTLVFFLSDNGLMWSEHGLNSKRVPYLASVRIPMVAAWPGHLAAGVKNPRLAANIDLFPTVMQAAGIETDPVDGRSLLKPNTRDHLLLEYWDEPAPTVPTWASYITNSFQYIRYYAANGSTVTFEEFYNLVNDPYQLTNRMWAGAPGSPPDVDGIAAKLEADRTCAGESCP